MSHHRRRVRRMAASLGLGLALATAMTATAFAGNGNNGTVKVQEGAADPTPVVQNEPHVCTFHLSFFFADAGQSGDWSIEQQPPTGHGPTVLSGSYLTDANGYDQTVEFGLPIGHYALSWDGRDGRNQKHKTFWVTCDNQAGPIGGSDQQE
jgi:hypothetical protein